MHTRASLPLAIAWTLSSLVGCDAADDPCRQLVCAVDGDGGAELAPTSGDLAATTRDLAAATAANLSTTRPDLGPAAAPACYETCSAPSDCALPGLPLYDANHYACTAGRCAFLGCQGNSDCTAAFQKTNYACGAVAGSSVPACYESCGAPSDCAIPGLPLYDANHYACTAGRCAWQGCQSDSDCTAAFQKTNYACGSVPGVSVPSCYQTCSAPSDCATAGLSLYDASHYACTAGRCAFLGCQSNSDCTAAFQKTNYACN